MIFPPNVFAAASDQSVITGYLRSFLFRHILDSEDLYVILAFLVYQNGCFLHFRKCTQ